MFLLGLNQPTRERRKKEDIPVTVVWSPMRCRKRGLAEVEEREFGNWECDGGV